MNGNSVVLANVATKTIVTAYGIVSGVATSSITISKITKITKAITS